MALYPHISNGYLEYDTSGFPIVGGPADNVLEDFEDGTITAYSDFGGWTAQGTNVLRGRYSLESLDTNVWLGDRGNDRPTPRDDPPIEYRCRMLQEDAGRSAMLINVQAQDAPLDDSYAVVVDTADNRLSLVRYLDGTRTVLDDVAGTTHPRTGTEYIPAITVSTEGLKATLYDRAGTTLLETNSMADQSLSGGGLGWHNESGLTAFYDHATYGPGSLDELQGTRTWLEDFEDGSISEYTILARSGDEDVTPAAAYRGNYGLEQINASEIQSMPGDGLDGYLRSGEEILIRTNFQVIGEQQYWVPFCMADASSTDNRYRLEFLMGGGFRIRKTENGSTSTLPGTSSEGRDYAALYDITHYDDYWYSAILLVDESYGVYAEMHDAGNNIKGWVHSSDTEFIDGTNGIGFRSSGSGHVYFDHLFEIDQQYFDDTGRTEPIPHSDAP